jgi:hypothetical protein
MKIGINPSWTNAFAFGDLGLIEHVKDFDGWCVIQSFAWNKPKSQLRPAVGATWPRRLRLWSGTDLAFLR